MNQVLAALDDALSDWDLMQSLMGDEGAEAAERFERRFYQFIDHFEQWFNTQQSKPINIDIAEEHPDIKKIMSRLPGPLYLPFYNELDRIIEGKVYRQYD